MISARPTKTTRFIISSNLSFNFCLPEKLLQNVAINALISSVVVGALTDAPLDGQMYKGCLSLEWLNTWWINLLSFLLFWWVQASTSTQCSSSSFHQIRARRRNLRLDVSEWDEEITEPAFVWAHKLNENNKNPIVSSWQSFSSR